MHGHYANRRGHGHDVGIRRRSNWNRARRSTTRASRRHFLSQSKPMVDCRQACRCKKQSKSPTRPPAATRCTTWSTAPTRHISTTSSIARSTWTSRIGGLRANASKLSHAELDEMTELDAGDPVDLASHYVAFERAFVACGRWVLWHRPSSCSGPCNGVHSKQLTHQGCSNLQCS